MQFNYNKEYINDHLLPWNKNLMFEKSNDKNNSCGNSNYENELNYIGNNLNYDESNANCANNLNDIKSNSNVSDTGWINYNKTKNSEKKTVFDEEEYQVCLAVKCPINKVQFVTPFFIHIPYSSCRIFNNGKSYILKLKTFCYFTRLATYVLLRDDNISCSDEEWNNIFKEFYINAIKINTNYDLNKIIADSDLSYFFAKTIDNNSIHLPNIKIEFKNILNQNIYPFIFCFNVCSCNF